MEHRYNWKPDLPDYRDHRYATYSHGLFGAEMPPAFVDLSSKCSPVFNQGQLGSCTSQAIAGAMEFLELTAIQSKTASAIEFDPNIFVPLSRLFIYYNEREMEGDVNQDGGAQIRDGIKSVATLGNCKEITWSYHEPLVFTKPSPGAYKEALTHKISSYARLNSLLDMKHCLVSGFPFVFGFTVYNYFESEEMSKTGILKMPTPEEECMGGHAVMAVGYNDIDKTFLVRNSWGADWGQKGYFTMPYDYITDDNLCNDFWVLRK